MPRKKLKRIKRDLPPTGEMKNVDSCLFTEMPVEILEMIFGNLNFTDLPNLLLISRGMAVLPTGLVMLTRQSSFNATRYSPQFQVVKRYFSTLTELFEAIWKNPQAEWRVHDVLKAITDEFCEVRHP